MARTPPLPCRPAPPPDRPEVLAQIRGGELAGRPDPAEVAGVDPAVGLNRGVAVPRSIIGVSAPRSLGAFVILREGFPLMAARSVRSKVAAGSRPGEAQKPDSVKLKITVDRETARLIRLEAFGRDVSLGQVVTDMVRAYPRRFVLMDRNKGAQGSEGQANGPGPGPSSARGDGGPLGVVSEAG